MKTSRAVLSKLWADSFPDRKLSEANRFFNDVAFRMILDRERAVADRYGRKFSLIIFDVSLVPPDSRILQTVVDILARRIRKTDIAGWMGRHRIGVILAYTERMDAEKVADEICCKVGAMTARLHCSVYGYPSCGSKEKAKGAETVLKSQGAMRIDRHSSSVRSDPAGECDVNHSNSRKTVGREDEPFMDAIWVSGIPWWKRVLDIAVASLGLLVFSPIMLLMALLIKAVSPGPVFFKQERVGYLGRKFMCWKFRTMHVQADQQVHEKHFSNLMQSDAPMTKLDSGNDRRLIPMGAILRASGLDELPQLFNVLRGDMSFIGPRPCIPYEFDHYLHWQKRRCETLPGLTGLWQVQGKNRTTFNEMMRLDISYAQNRTFWGDLKILFHTPAVVLAEVKQTIVARKHNRVL